MQFGDRYQVLLKLHIIITKKINFVAKILILIFLSHNIFKTFLLTKKYNPLLEISVLLSKDKKKYIRIKNKNNKKAKNITHHIYIYTRSLY